MERRRTFSHEFDLETIGMQDALGLIGWLLCLDHFAHLSMQPQRRVAGRAGLPELRGQ